jgi:hypothetical protein
MSRSEGGDVDCGGNKTAAASAGDLAALTAGSSRFVRRPFVGRPFLVRGTAAFAGDLALLVD